MNRPQVEIEYAHGNDTYKVVLTATSLDVFKAAAESADVNVHSGEKLVSALFAFAGTAITGVERYKNGKYNDGPAGEPAIEKFEDGQIRFRRLYQDGYLTDGPFGEPAMQDFVGGKLQNAITYRYGRKAFRQLTRLEISELPDVIAQNKRDAAKAAYFKQVKFSGPK